MSAHESDHIALLVDNELPVTEEILPEETEWHRQSVVYGDSHAGLPDWTELD